MNRNGLEQVAGRIATQGLLLATGPLLARAAGPAGRGEAALGVALGVLLPPLVGAGFGSAVRALSTADGPHVAAMRRAGQLRAVIGGAVGLAVAMALYASGLLDIGTSSRNPLLLMGATVGLSAYVDGYVSLRLIQGRPRQAVLTRVLPVAVFATYCLTLFALGALTAPRYLIGYACLPILRFAVVSAGSGRRGLGSTEPRPPWLSTGRWGIPHEISDAGLAQVALLAAGLTLDAAALGLLSVGLTVSRLPSFVASGVSDGDVEAIAASRSGGTAFALASPLRSLVLTTALAAGLTAAIGWLTVPIVFGEEFRDSRAILLILLVTAPFAGSLNYISSYLVASGRTAQSARLQLITFALAGLLAGGGAAAFEGPTSAAWGLSIAVGVGGLAAAVRVSSSLRS